MEDRQPFAEQSGSWDSVDRHSFEVSVCRSELWRGLVQKPGKVMRVGMVDRRLLKEGLCHGVPTTLSLDAQQLAHQQTAARMQQFSAGTVGTLGVVSEGDGEPQGVSGPDVGKRSDTCVGQYL